MTRRTKIVATIGPASDGPESLRKLLNAGVDVFRLGLAHGSIDDHLRHIRDIRKVAEEMSKPVAVLGDLPGPKIRMGQVNREGGIFLAEGEELRLRTGQAPTTEHEISIDYPHLGEALYPGDPLVLGDGAVRLVVREMDGDEAVIEVEHGGRIQGRPGVTLPSARLRVSVPTSRDIELLDALAGKLDFVAASFVRASEEVTAVKDRSGAAAVIAKIETKAAVDQLEAIVETADAVMVARGDLGNECEIAELPHLQKRIIRSTVSFGVPVITATQMLESMTNAPTPTRAEATDVANAVFDGTTAVMLSGETAIGRNPVRVVRTMSRLCQRAEEEADYVAWGARLGKLQGQVLLDESSSITAAISQAAWRVAIDLDLDAIVCCTRTGYTARAISRFRPPGTLIGASYVPETVRQLSLVWGIRPLLVDRYEHTDEMVWHVVERGVNEGHIRHGDVIAVLAGAPAERSGATDVLRIVRVK